MPDDFVSVITPEGTVGHVAASEVNQLGSGFRVATPTEVQEAQLKEKYGSTGQQALAFGSGVASGLTFGTTDYLAASSSEEARKALQAYRVLYPGTLMTGEITGGVAGLALSGGLGGVGKATQGVRAAEELSALGKVGRVLGAPTGAVSRLSGEARALGELLPGRAGRLIGAGLEGGVEAAIDVAGHTIGEAAVQNQSLTAEQLAASTMQGALFGGAFGVGIRGIGMGMGAAKDKLLGAVSAGDGLTNRIADLAATATGKDREAMRRFMSMGPEGKEARRLIFEGADDLDSIAARMTDELEGAQRAFDETKFAANSAFKRESIAKNIRQDNLADQLLQVQEVYRQSRDHLETIIQDADRFWGGNQAKKLERRLQTYEQDLQRAVESGGNVSAAAYEGLDGWKKEVQQFTVAAQNSARTKATAPATVELLRKLDDSTLRPLLTSSDVWGNIGTAQRIMNEAWFEGLGGGLQKHHRDFFTSFGKDPNNPYAKMLLTADQAKVRSFLGQLDDPNRNIAMRALKEAQEFKRKYAQTALDTLEMSPQDAERFKKMLRGADATDAFIKEAGDKVALQNQFAKLSQDDGSGILGSAIGAGAGYLLGGEEGVGGALGGAALGAVLRPSMAIRRVAAIERLAGQVNTKVAAGFSRAFSKARPATVRAGASVLRAQGRAEERDVRIQAERRQMLLQSMQQQPEATAAELRGVYASLSPSAPNISGAAAGTTQRAIDYLIGQLPPQKDRLSVLDKPLGMSTAQAQEWQRKADAVEQPWSILEAASDSELTPDMVQAVQAVYPETYMDIQARGLDKLIELSERDEELPYTEQGQLATLLQMPVHPTHNPEMIAAAQAVFAARGQPAPKQQPRRGGGALPDQASDMLTGPEKLARGMS